LGQSSCHLDLIVSQGNNYQFIAAQRHSIFAVSKDAEPASFLAPNVGRFSRLSCVMPVGTPAVSAALCGLFNQPAAAQSHRLMLVP
jgi:hypothetical protein